MLGMPVEGHILHQNLASRATMWEMASGRRCAAPIRHWQLLPDHSASVRSSGSDHRGPPPPSS